MRETKTAKKAGIIQKGQRQRQTNGRMRLGHWKSERNKQTKIDLNRETK